MPFDEVRDTERAVRPDYAISVDGAITGYIEVKKPGASIDPRTFTGHNKRQWERQKDLPNLIYTNGLEWRLWRDGEMVLGPVQLSGPIEEAGGSLTAPPSFEQFLTDFLRWKPAHITSVLALVRAVAPLTRLLRGEVLDQITLERRAVLEGADERMQPFLGLAKDWRNLLFPTATDDVFADGYAQAVTFALLLARTEGLQLDGSLHDVGARLGGASHSLMGKALQLLTDNVAADFKVTLDLLVRVIGAVQWTRIRRGRRDLYLHLYEHFLEVYDPKLRKKSGSYYTPREIVEEMTRLAEEVLVSRLGKEEGFRDPGVVTIDPAMGTGTFLHEIVERVAESVKESDGPGVVPPVVTELARRLVGFELQMGPYAVAELRTSDLLRDLKAQIPGEGLRLFVTDTLDDPHAEVTQLGSGLELIAASRRNANKVKAQERVTVVIGNPPYVENAAGRGGWVTEGDPSQAIPPLLDDFRVPGDGVYVQNLHNLYVYFWRWATWKVWESTPALGDSGLVCFISTSGYLRGPGFRGMRRYLRRNCSEGWIVDLTPEGQTPDVSTRVFPGVRQPLAIGLFVRTSNKNPDEPAPIHYRSLAGRRADKFAALGSVKLDGEGWRDARTGWEAPFSPAALTSWDDLPALGDLMPFVTPGMAANRTWIFAPAPALLSARWNRLVAEDDPKMKKVLFKESAAAKLDMPKEPLPGFTEDQRTERPFRLETGGCPVPVRVGFRAFDRQWAIPDSRLWHRPRRTLWASRVAGQVFVVEMNSQPISSGPGLVFSSLIPDMHYFKGSEGGRTLPMLHPSREPNLAPRLLEALEDKLSGAVTVEDVIAYVAAIVAHPAFTSRFADELTTPGIRVPITADAELWRAAVELGRTIVWLHTYGEAFTDPAAGRDSIRFQAGDTRRIVNQTPVEGMPETMAYDQATQRVRIGTGEWGPVPKAAFEYAVGGKNVLRSWFNYRKANPGGKKTSPLDEMKLDVWQAAWSVELIELLSVLTRLVEAEPAQDGILERVLDGPLISADELSAAGVKWPTTKKDRVARFELPQTTDADEEGQLTIPLGGVADASSE
ncbi:type ISP restriction/modification enzyme [Micromonospora chalcea]|uniref:type ISP restriction/modification enzyme n=1 Tax=Micromonospora chalcea TaxID=1874 RepID=UPI001CA754BD|nr:type ISP restriction/modification enzyme [Micromonospora chalcea]